MFNVSIRLVSKNQRIVKFQLDTLEILTVIPQCFSACRRLLDGMDLEFLHLWHYTYAIWGNKRPQGCLIIEEQGQVEES